jgi:formylglycine-generating enzyme required for sulfatase activity
MKSTKAAFAFFSSTSRKLVRAIFVVTMPFPLFIPLAIHAEPLKSASPPAATSVSDAPVKSFKDCLDCPEMVIVPAGSYMMGSPKTEIGRGEEEQHKIT